ncbi:MAG TPA: hypothetical protein PK649_05460 [Vicingus sp.]|nr:hypothetical protein [Vicingus sp.]
MGTFSKSFTREIGKNTGKWVSNKIFGDGHATPHKLIHVRDKENARKERENARAYKEHQKQLEQDRKERERDLKQREKEIATLEKQEMIEANNAEVVSHNNYIDVIQSVHKDYSKKMDWNKMLEIKEPDYVETLSEIENKIEPFVNQSIIDDKRDLQERGEKQLSFGVKFFQKISKGKINGFINMLFFKKDMETIRYVAQKLNEIDNSRNERIEALKNIANENHQNYLKDKQDYHKIIDIAKGVLNKDSQSYTYALNFFNPFEDLKEYGSDISFNVKEASILIDFFVHSEDVVPKTIKKSLHKGLEVKEEPIPISRFNEIYQDYVCSCILRISKEVFQLLPIDNVLINAKGTIINPATGNNEEKTIVSVIIEKEKLDKLNFDLLDPSDSMSNFSCNMNFKKSEGFKPVEELSLT